MKGLVTLPPLKLAMTKKLSSIVYLSKLIVNSRSCGVMRAYALRMCVQFLAQRLAQRLLATLDYEGVLTKDDV